MMKKTTKQRVLGGIALLLLLGIGSCLKSTVTPPPTVKTYISVMHLAASTPAAEVYFSDEKVTQPIGSGSFFPAYSAVSPATFDVKFKKASSDSVMATIPSSHYDSLKFYTLLLYNDPQGAAKAIRITDNFSSITQDKAFFRFFNMSPDAPLVDLYIQNTKVSPNRTPADNTTDNDLNFFNPYTPGSYLLAVKKTGTDSVIVQTNAVFAASNAYTVFIKGLAAGTGDNKLSLAVLRAAN